MEAKNSWFERFIHNTLFVVVCLLTLLSFFTTQRCGQPSAGEIDNGAPIYKIYDNVLLQIVALSALLITWQLCLSVRKKSRKLSAFIRKYILLFQAFLACAAGIFSFLLFTDGIRTPIDDQIQVYSAALCFDQGNYINLSPGGYVEMYPQQLGYIFFLQIIFRLFGNYSFQIIQILNCILIAGIVFSVCLVLDNLASSTLVRIAGSLLLFSFLPLYLLHSWGYGDIPFLFCLFLFIHLYLRYIKHPRKITAACGIVTAVLSLLFRKNAMILLIAAGILLFIRFLKTRQAKDLVFLILLLVLPFGSVSLLEKHYESVSGYEITGGLPTAAWITMGTLEDNSTPGWFNNFSVPVYYATGYDRTETAALSLSRLKERMTYFKENPVYTLSFYKRKIATQWNDPYYHTDYLIKTDNTAAGGITGFLLHHEKNILLFLSFLQTVIYLGCLFYLFPGSSDTGPASQIAELYILGGFFFSLLWEANSRYVLPYFLSMFPLAAMGWQRAETHIGPFLQHFHDKYKHRSTSR